MELESSPEMDPESSPEMEPESSPEMDPGSSPEMDPERGVEMGEGSTPRIPRRCLLRPVGVYDEGWRLLTPHPDLHARERRISTALALEFLPFRRRAIVRTEGCCATKSNRLPRPQSTGGAR
jgi:hypothetical protein